MINRKKQTFYIYYILDNGNKYLYSIKDCKQPERTSEYLKLKSWLNSQKVYSIGWCDNGYFEDYKPTFFNSDYKIKPVKLTK